MHIFISVFAAACLVFFGYFAIWSSTHFFRKDFVHNFICISWAGSDFSGCRQTFS